ncbi:hypothetical protein BFN03_11730 [Rhodococcus sp. WMMA185]|uniref:PPE domain-containing protein n=1 Tax=Rhodococcus sp. WMMA185 TaxID=679318 RepID=UPI0008783742|nr:hypothetical protein [Rhodococcus sp. WMMA185]AOW93091.1 hypothetical protein BFN03_11730 [Rhodococcus sp. WMMA185]
MERENFQSSDWDHQAIKSAVDSLAPADSGAVAATWDDLGRRFQESIVSFHTEIRSAIDSGWRGTTAAAVGSAIEEYTTGAWQVGDQFSDVGAALRHAISGAEAVRGAVGPPIDHATDWSRVLPWKWAGEADAHAEEQNAKAAMETLYTSAYRGAAEHLPVLHSSFPNDADRGLDPAATEVAAAPQPIGLDVGPNGIHGIPSDQQVAAYREPSNTSNEHEAAHERLQHESPHAGASPAPSSISSAALAGAVGGGVAHYAQRVLAAHRSAAAEPEPSTLNNPADEHDTEVQPPTYLESIDEGSELVGRLAPVSPAVIGE